MQKMKFLKIAFTFLVLLSAGFCLFGFSHYALANKASGSHAAHSHTHSECPVLQSHVITAALPKTDLDTVFVCEDSNILFSTVGSFLFGETIKEFSRLEYSFYYPQKTVLLLAQLPRAHL